MNINDRPAGKIEDTIQSVQQKHIESGKIPTCYLCKSKNNTYDIIEKNGLIYFMHYIRGKVFLCKPCYRLTIVGDNIAWCILQPIIKIIRRFQK